MKALDRPRLTRYAREQIRAAGVILARHCNQGPLCSCGRVEPCSAKLHVLRRLRHFEDLLSALDAPTVIIPAANDALVGEVVGRTSASGQRHNQAEMRRTGLPLIAPLEPARWT